MLLPLGRFASLPIDCDPGSLHDLGSSSFSTGDCAVNGAVVAGYIGGLASEK